MSKFTPEEHKEALMEGIDAFFGNVMSYKGKMNKLIILEAAQVAGLGKIAKQKLDEWRNQKATEGLSTPIRCIDCQANGTMCQECLERISLATEGQAEYEPFPLQTKEVEVSYEFSGELKPSLED